MVEFILVLIIALAVAYGIVVWHQERVAKSDDEGGFSGHKADKMSSTER